MTTKFHDIKVAVMTLGLAAAAHPVASQEPVAVVQPYLDVSGEGRVSVQPDMATIRLGVVAEAVTPGEAVEAMNAPMSDLIDTLLSQQIDPRDIQTSELRLRPVYADRERPLGDGQEITGFEAASDVSVQVRALDTLGGVLDRAVSAGSNRFDGLTFGLSDPVPAQDAALAAAVADALRKAAILAEGADVTLGPILQISEQGGGAPPSPMMMRAEMNSDVAVAPGSVETQVRVSVRFALTP